MPRQTCCGQPAYNSGDRRTTREIAEQVIEAFAPYDYVVAPSGSCAGMLKLHYPRLFRDDPNQLPRAQAFAEKTFELISFLVDVLGVAHVPARFEGTVTYHDGCSGLRELGVKSQPRKLLAGVEGLKLTEMRDADVCCGFGGTFCVKYPDISNAIVAKKADHIAATGAIIAGARKPPAEGQVEAGRAFAREDRVAAPIRDVRDAGLGAMGTYNADDFESSLRHRLMSGPLAIAFGLIAFGAVEIHFPLGTGTVNAESQERLDALGGAHVEVSESAFTVDFVDLALGLFEIG